MFFDGADLSGADLSGKNLRFCNLSGIDFTDADFTNADLFLADLQDAFFPGADLTRALGPEVDSGSPIFYPDTICSTGLPASTTANTCAGVGSGW